MQAASRDFSHAVPRDVENEFDHIAYTTHFQTTLPSKDPDYIVIKWYKYTGI